MSVRHYLHDNHAVAVICETPEYVAVVCTYCKINRHFTNETKAIEVADDHFDNIHKNRVHPFATAESPDYGMFQIATPHPSTQLQEVIDANNNLASRVDSLENNHNRLSGYVDQINERLTETAHSIRNWDLLQNTQRQMITAVEHRVTAIENAVSEITDWMKNPRGKK